MYYYCFIRMQNIVHMEYSVHNASLSTTPYYEAVYSIIKKVIHMPGFPMIQNKNTYMSMLPKESTYSEENYPTFNWKRIWKNFSSIVFYPYEKEIVFKHLHLCLATNQRLAMLGRSTTGLCTKCPDNADHTPVHMLYQCETIKPLFLWLLRVLLKLCNFRPVSNIKLLYFDAIYENLFQKTVCNAFIYVYILTIWKTRKENLRIGILKNMIVKRVPEYFNFMRLFPNKSIERIYEEISRLDIDDLTNV